MKYFLLYQAYGSKEIIAEMLYSIMTFLDTTKKETLENTEIIIYTDSQSYIASFLKDIANVKIIPVSEAAIKDWKGDINFSHRVKIKLIEDFFKRFEGKLLYVDTDTVFTKDITPVYELISDKNVVMHVFEGKVNSGVNRVMKKTHRFIKKNTFKVGNNNQFWIPEDTEQWNAGVLGLQKNHSIVLNDVIELTEGIYRLWDLNGAEQLSFSYFLQKNFYIHPALEYIYHYWYFKEFRQVVTAFFEYHKGKRLLDLLRYIPNIDPQRLEKPKVAYRSLNPIGRFLRRLKGQPWKMPDYSFE